MAKYTLPELPYDFGALEPHLSARILELHHDKHHAGYVKKANSTLDQLSALRDSEKSEPVLLHGLERALAFNVSGHLLHSLYWPSMTPDGGGRPEGELGAAIGEAFGSFDAFQAQMDGAIESLQGSGWAALVWEPLAGRLMIQQIYDHQANMTPANLPLLVIDGWEHAYYLQYENRKEEFIAATWKVVDWERVAARFGHAQEMLSGTMLAMA